MKTSWKTIRVFVSSTFRDMYAERDYLVRFVFEKVRQELFKRRIHLIDIDLRWGISSEQDVQELCREIIDECRPRFICLLGGRYGWIPPGKDKSITEDEIRYAALDLINNKRGYNYFYLRDDQSTLQIIEKEPGAYREAVGSLNYNKLQQLIKLITNNGYKLFSYHAKWDIQNKQLTELESLGDQIYKDLLESIDDEFGKENNVQLNEFEEENAAMDAFIEDKTQNYILGSRDYVSYKIIDHINSVNKSYLCITGAAGTGKSSFLAFFCKSYKATSSTIVIKHFVGASQNSTDIRKTLQRFCYELKSLVKNIDAEVPDEFEKLRSVFPQFLLEACVNHKVIIVLDAVNQMGSDSFGQNFEWLPTELPYNCFIIFSTQSNLQSGLNSNLMQHKRQSNTLLYVNQLITRIKPVQINFEPLTATDVKAIINQFEKRFHKHFNQQQKERLITKSASNNPLYLNTVLTELRTLNVSRTVKDSKDQDNAVCELIDELPSTTNTFFNWILNRLLTDTIFRDEKLIKIGNQIIPKALRLIGISRFGLSYNELRELVLPNDPKGNITALLYQLRPFLMNRTGLNDFYHNQFRETVLNKWLDSAEKIKDTHKTLADYFKINLWESDSRSISELPFHLASAGLYQEMIELLCNVTYLEEYVAHFGYGQLIEYLKLLNEIIDIKSPCQEQLSNIMDVLKSESGSFSDWNKDNRVPDFYCQLKNCAFGRKLKIDFYNQPGHLLNTRKGELLLQWSHGTETDDIKGRLFMEGNRESYAWDIYDFGPLGCSTSLWIDLNRNRLLTDTVSYYGSYSDNSGTHEPHEYDLTTDVLIIKHKKEVESYNEHFDFPKAFNGINVSLRSQKRIELPKEAEDMINKNKVLLHCSVICKSINSEELLLDAILKHENKTFDSIQHSHLCVYEPEKARIFCTSHQIDGLKIKAAVKIEGILTAFAIDEDQHVYRLHLMPRKIEPDSSVNIDFTISSNMDCFVCLTPESIDIRKISNGSLLNSYSKEDLLDYFPDSKIKPRHYMNEYNVKITPDNNWLVMMSIGSFISTRLYPNESKYLFDNGILNTYTKNWFNFNENKNRYAQEKNYGSYNSIMKNLTTRYGQYYIVQRRCTIEVWNIETGQLTGELGSGPKYGGGNCIYGIAAHPNENYVISSETEFGDITAWDLSKNNECWHLSGIGKIGKIESLTFLWGGHLVAALTESNFLYILKFWWQSEILAVIRLEQGAKRIMATDYGDKIFVLYNNGKISCYKYVPHSGNDVTYIDRNILKLRISLPEAYSVTIAGTFNNWDQFSSPLHLNENGIWCKDIELAPGRHEYKLFMNDSQWFLDPKIPFKRSTFGENNYVEIE